MENAEEVLVVFLSTALAVFLLLSIILLIILIRIAIRIKRISDKAELISEKAERVADFVSRAATPLAIGRFFAAFKDIFSGQNNKQKRSKNG